MKFHLSSILKAVTLVVGLLLCAHSFAASVSYTNETDFQTALNGSFTLVNLDAAPLATHASGYRVEDAGPASDFATLGIDFINANAQVVGSQAFQIPKAGRDRLILNGPSFNGNIAFDFVTAVNGIGAWSNYIDGGHIRAYDGLGLTGNLIGEADLDGGSFGGLISSGLIQSAEITCEFNGDLKCGVFDIQFGTTLSAVPVPATVWLLGSALVGIFGWRKKATA